jgi:membrane associated rhomboid family serine protease
MAYSSTGFSNPFGFRVTPWVKRLLIANAVMFLVTALFGGLVGYLAFTPARILYQPWTLVTYMFVHAGLFHLLFNMLALFFFGPPLEERWGSTDFVRFYLLTGLGGALLSLLFPYQSIVGASAAVYGVMVAFAMYWPENPIYIWGIFPVKAKWLVTFLIGLSLFSAVTGREAGVAHLAHLGGAAAAFLYIRSSWAPGPYGRPARQKRAGSASSSWRLFTSKEEASKPPATTTAKKPAAAERRREMHRALDDVDKILDKISAGGMASLTDEERRRLEEASKRFRSS